MKKVIVKDNMSKNVLTVSWADDLQSSYEKMKKAEVRHLVVVDEFGFLRGVISDRDFQRAMFVDSDFMFNEEARAGFDEGAIVRDFMSWPAETMSSKTKIKEVAQQMIKKKISAFVITEDDEEATGIITHEDLLRVLVQLLDDKSTLRDRIEQAIYKSPVGSVVNLLKEMGI